MNEPKNLVINNDSHFSPHRPQRTNATEIAAAIHRDLTRLIQNHIHLCYTFGDILNTKCAQGDHLQNLSFLLRNLKSNTSVPVV